MKNTTPLKLFKKAGIPPYIIYIILAAAIALILFISVHKIFSATLPN